MGACARNMYSDPAEIKPAQCCIKLVFHLTISLSSDCSLWQAHSLFPSKFFAQRDLVLSVCLSVCLYHFVVSLRSSAICHCIISRLFALLSIFPSVMCFRGQFLHNMWPIQLTFLPFAVCTISLCSLPLCNTPFLTRSIQLTFSILLHHHISKLSRYFWSTSQSVHVSAQHQATAPNVTLYWFPSTFFRSNLLVNRISFLCSVEFPMALLDLVSRADLTPFVSLLPH